MYLNIIPMKTVVVRRACRYWLIPWKQKETVKWETFFHLIPSVASSLFFGKRLLPQLFVDVKLSPSVQHFFFSQVIMEKHFLWALSWNWSGPEGSSYFFRTKRSLSWEQQPNKIWTVTIAKWKLNDLSNLTPMRDSFLSAEHNEAI